MMDRSLFSYVWKHSRREQIVLLALTVLTFPILYATLELPKRIINDAIDAEPGTVLLFGFELGRIEYLMVLSVAFLVAVTAWGLVKMRLNTMKGIMAERLLRRFRYQLVSRMLRFPLPHFRRTSQGEMVSIITSESEPLGGIMGDMLAQPVFQAGQMITILGFLFAQNIWFGLTAIALIPLQAWLIPLLQRQVNLLNKERVQEVRRFSERIGETVAGVEDIRANGVAPYTMAHFTAGLGRLFEIRYRIYQKKYFMKFVNNLISQLTPFFFFSIGGYLVIAGSLSLGALVAALAAYKDLSSPWKELLAYYNQSQDMGLRYETVIEQFDPPGLLDETLFEGRPDSYPHLDGDIVFENVTVREPDGGSVLDRLSFTIPAGSNTAIQAQTSSERLAIAQLLSRTILPSSGRVLVGGKELSSLHQGVIGARIGVAGTKPYLFKGLVEDNTRLALRTKPVVGPVAGGAEPDERVSKELREARRVGNSTDRADLQWLDLEPGGFASEADLYEWWREITVVMGTDGVVFDRGVDVSFVPSTRPGLAKGIVALRPEARRRLHESGLQQAIYPFDRDTFNKGQALGGNILYAVSRRRMQPRDLADDPQFAEFLDHSDLRRDTLQLGADLLSVIAVTFGDVGGKHPLLRRLGLEPELFAWLTRIDERRAAGGIESLCDYDGLLLSALPFCFSAEQIGRSFPDALKQKILAIRRPAAADLGEWGAQTFSPIEEDRFIEGLSVLENLFFGRLSRNAGVALDRLHDLGKTLLEENDLRTEVAALIGDHPLTVGGTNISPISHERISFIRAITKRPDILVLDTVLTSHEQADRIETRLRLRSLMPRATILHLEPRFDPREIFDTTIELANGRLVRDDDGKGMDAEASGQTDLARKLRAFEKTSLFGRLSRSQLRLLAFASQWFEARKGTYIFREGDEADGAYLVTSGVAELAWGDVEELEFEQRIVRAGRLIGDLSVISDERRQLDLIVREDVTGLRIGAAEFMEVLRHDPAIAVSLLRTVSGYLTDAARQLRELRAISKEEEAPRPSEIAPER